jgi:hypothetical protein
MRRTTGALEALGILVIGVSVWGGIVAFVGPTFDFDTGTTTRAWVWTQSHWTLGLAPAVLGIVGGLMIAMPRRRAVERLGAVFALIAGAWFVLGPTLEPLWQQGGITTSGSDGITQSRLIRVLEGIGYHYGTGTVLMLLGAFALGLLATAPARAAATAPAGTPVRTTAEPAPEHWARPGSPSHA